MLYNKMLMRRFRDVQRAFILVKASIMKDTFVDLRSV